MHLRTGCSGLHGRCQIPVANNTVPVVAEAPGKDQVGKVVDFFRRLEADFVAGTVESHHGIHCRDQRTPRHDELVDGP